MRRSLGRRKLLRGMLAGGVAVQLGLPLLESMLNTNGTALAQGEALPKRFGLFFFGNGRGVDADRWNPAQTGADYELSPILKPLANVKDYVSVVSGMQARLDNSSRAHHRGAAAILSGYDYIAQEATNAPYRSTFAKRSIDQRVAAVVGEGTPFRSLELGLTRRLIYGEGTTLQYVSHNGPDSGNPAEVEPLTVYERLFAGKAEQSTMVGQRLQMLRSSVLDSVKEDLTSLQTRVSAADRARLDQHAESIRAIERRLLASTMLAERCQSVVAPEKLATSWDKEPLAERMAAMTDLLALALACDLTRVFTIQFTGSVGATVFWQVGTSRGQHALSHDGEATKEVTERITVFAMEQLALLLERLRDTPDGAGHLLDSLALLATSDHSDGAAHSVDDFPIVVAGRAGGALTHPGVHYASPQEHTNRVLLTLLRANGVTIEALGQGSARTRSGCSALET